MKKLFSQIVFRKSNDYISKGVYSKIQDRVTKSLKDRRKSSRISKKVLNSDSDRLDSVHVERIEYYWVAVVVILYLVIIL